MKVNALQTSWSGGELSPRLDGRPDLKKFSQGARVLENMLVMPHGGVRKRSGTKFVIKQKAATDVALVPFQYSTEQSYILAFGDGYIWFFKDGGIITHASVNITGVTQANPAVVTANSHGFSNGDYVLIQSVGGMTELNNRWFVVAGATANTFQLTGIDSSAYTAYTSGGVAAEIVEIDTDYTADEVLDLQFAQSADTLYIVHKDHHLQKLQRSSHTSWTLSEPDITTGPFRTVNSDRTHKITVSVTTTAVTGATQANPCVVTFGGGHSFVAGQYITFASVGGMTDLNGNTYLVANPTATTLELSSVDSTAFGAYTTGGTAEPARTTYGTYIVGQTITLTATGGHTPFTSSMVGSIMRLSEEGLSSGYMAAPIGDSSLATNIGQMYTNAGYVYGITNKSVGAFTWAAITRVPAHDSGQVRVYTLGSTDISSPSNWFDAAFLHPTYCVVRLTGYTSSAVMTAELVRYQMPASVITNGTSYWEEGAWSDRRGYPRAITFYEQRLFMAGVEGDPSVVWGSRTGAYENFEDGSDDAHALIYRVAAKSADVIRWLKDSRVLTAGTSFGEFAFASSSQNQALTPSNVKATQQTNYGTSSCHPVQINQAVLYPQRRGDAENPAKKLREFQYRYDADAFGSTDMTVFSEHIFGDGITRLAYQTEPDSIIWSRRTDGLMAGCTYERLQEVVAWHRHALGGSGAAVKTIGVIPGEAGDELWMSVERTIAGGAERYIEVMAPTFKDDDDKEDAKLLDSHLTYEGSSTTTISGLWHLRGETVKILNNGNVETGTVTSMGRLTLSRATTKAHIGHGYAGIIESEDIEAGAQAGTAQSRAKRISQVYILVLNSLGGSAGPNTNNQRPLLYRRAAQPMGSSPPLFSGHVELDFPGGWDRVARVRIEHDDPLPFHVTSLVAELSTVG